ncbi:SusC/RagA family TonB-linked outer membrane protein [Parabacteroides johnsonii]|uniref:SusC/RagA family TonB-linked outer membrane protein n=1 Tax=Parabacteroides johnsonii TaxID=387661 RepID=UPI00265D31BA|nr:TonB-dependent receptor [Parabacteroides johnsonii]
MKRFFWILFVMSLWGHLLLAQEKTVSGIVISTEDGLPMIGVAVVDKQTMNGVTTNEKGEFSMAVSPRTKTLHLSYLGYKTKEVSITGRSMKIEMEPDMVAIDEVMVVAYGTGKKSTFTGSASVVKKESLEKIKASNVTQALQGQSSGVQVLNNSGEPGADATIMIRGIGSMNASSSPLYVVDGTAYDGYLNSINPNDIESMTILKDASATALYGSRAANGVVMITTRKGASEKGQINFRSTWGFSSLAVDLPRQLTPDEFSVLTWRSLYNGYKDWGSSENEAASWASTYLTGEFGCNPYNVAQPVGMDGKMNPDAKLLYSEDWRDALFASRLRQEYTIDFSGKSKKADYYISGGYLNDKGVFSIQKFERFSTRANLNYNVNKWLKVGTNVSLSHSLREGSAGTSTVWFLRTMPTVYSIYQRDASTGNIVLDKNGKPVYDYGDYRTSWSGWNPVADDIYNKYPWTHDDVSSRSYLEITFMPGLKWRTNLSVDFYQYNYDGYSSSEYGYSAGYKGEVSKESDRNFSYTVNNLLTYEKSFGDHSLSVLLGQEAYSLKFKLLSASKQGLPFPGVTEIGSAAVMSAMNSYEDNYRLLSWLSRVEYDYKDRYYVSGSFRTDGSSRFHPDNRWGQFWSLGGSWRISNEEFMKPYSSWLDNLKLKVSYGAVGNDNLGTYYAYQGLYATGMNNYRDPGVMVSRLANKDLKWESNMQFNVGVDFALFNKLSGSIEWFNRKSKDLLFTLPMAPSTGFSGIDRNVGDVKNQGVEFSLNYAAVSNKDFKWTIDLNGTSYKNRITKLPQNEINAGVFKWREGESRYNFWGVEYAGVNPETGNDQYWKNVYETNDKGEKVLVDRVKTEDYNEVTSDSQMKYLGDAIPKLFGGFTNNFSYKGVDLSFMIYYSFGGKLYDSDYAQMMSYRTGYSMHPDMLDSWTPENTSAKYPRISNAYANYLGTYTSKFIFNNTFARLRNVTLGYTLPKSLTSKFQVNMLRVFVQGDNLVTVGSATRRGTDPEQSVSGTTDNRFPVTKSVSFGLQLTL